ncbi:ATPase [Geomonas silvestris]|uniref:ATPase n=1 Tax=Geomonas silvestris TaxID=2740184 RepID=A0A6V8MKQ6_9BACT|nr:SRPBCC family protein [Geomonas silvestris]GFO60514.1 ATPase [Geomonas silvestris]
MSKSEFIYTIYIKTTPEKLWDALTNVEFMKQYWFGTHCESDWRAGSSWRLVFADGQTADAGEIVESVAPKRLAIRWRNEWNPELKEEGYSLCVFDIEPTDSAVKLTVTHSLDKEGSKLIEAVSGGWPQVLSNIKSLLETGQVVLAQHVDCREKA